MKYILLFLFVLGSLISCSSESDTVTKGQRELVPNPEKFEHDGYANLPDSLRPIFKPDTTIGSIHLISSKNIIEYLGANVMDRLEEGSLPHSTVWSSDKQQALTFYFHPGNVENRFSEFKINYTKNKKETFRQVTDKVFETESKIKLGITIGDLKSIKGEPHRITKKEIITFHYRVDDYESSIFLKKYKMPIYYADYDFRNGYLQEFRFGFEYP